MSRHLVTAKLLSLAALGLLVTACGDDDGGVPQVCGDNAITGTEQCDATQLGGNTCRTIAGSFTGGTLGCTATCSFDTSGCTTGAEVCGNGDQETGEECDGNDLGGATCASVGAFLGGTLGCQGDCTFDVSLCEAAPSCGDHVRNGTEDCDDADLGAATCLTVGAYVGGTLGCRSDCTFDVSLCEAEIDCGNGDIDAPEQCDGTNLNNATCLTIAGGYVGGVLACGGDCRFDVTGCIAPACGDDVINQGTESCDGTDLGDETCESVGSFTGGVLACTAGCAFDTTGCIAPPTCGNGTLDAFEPCDATLLGGATCLTVPGGFGSGVLACAGDCTFDTTGCVLPFCGDGDINQGSEDCDGEDLGGQTCGDIAGYSGGVLTCSSGCELDLSGCLPDPFCGDHHVNQPAEDCDGADLDGQTCQTVGAFTGGDLACTAGCLFDTTGCTADPRCGDGVVNQGIEHCDGNDLSGQDCASVDSQFVSGALACAAGCTFDTSGCLTAADELAVVRQATSVPPTGLRLSAVYVTYVKPLVGDDPAGFFVQATAEGPALFVAVNPTSLSPVPAVGDRLGLTVRAVATVDGQKRATSVDSLVRESTGYDVSLLSQEVTGVADLVSAIDSYESELISADLELTGDPIPAGSGHVAATVNSTAVIGSPDLRLRLTSTVAAPLELETGCLLTVTETPLWRFNAVAQISAWNPGEISNLVCPAPRVLSAESTGSTTVVITFSRTLDPASVVDPGAQVVFDVAGFDALAASVVGSTLVVTTDAQVPGQTYQVIVDGTVTDTLGTGVDPAHDTATFTTPSANVCEPAVVISQLYPGGGNASATYCDDFVELHNRSGDDVDIAGWSLQYASETGSTWSVRAIPATPARIIPAGGFFLILLDGGTSPGCTAVPLVDLDLSTSTGMGGAGGKVALLSTSTAMSAGVCPVSAALQDFVEFGALAQSCASGTKATWSTNTLKSLSRGNDVGGHGPGCLFTSPPSTGGDFSIIDVTPRASTTPVEICECGQ
jgi:hypothetical protein